jgi:putative membrane protein
MDEWLVRMLEDKDSVKVRNRRVHMANERTFLAWIRTSVGIMAFGFVVEKFALFVKQMSLILGKADIENRLPPSHGYSAIVGIFLVGLGTLMGLLAFIKYKKVQRQIDEDTYQTSSILDLALALSVFAVGVCLVIYLIQSA